MAKTGTASTTAYSTASVTAFENKNIEGATKSAPSGNKKGAGKFRIVHVAGKNRSFVCKDGTLDADGTPKEFSTKSAAAAWIDRNHPSGMTWEFEIYDNLRGETVAIVKPAKKAKAGTTPKTADKSETGTVSTTAFEGKDIGGATKSASPKDKEPSGKFVVIFINGGTRLFVCKDGKVNINGPAKEFSTKSAAVAWINKNAYNGMTYRYEIYDTVKRERFLSTGEPKPEPQKAEIIPADRTSVVACTKEQVREHLKTLDDAVASFEKTFFKIGLELYWFYTTQAYVSIDGVEYANIADFAKKRYGISKATTYQYINVYDRFGKLDTVTGDCIGIDDKYKDYGSTQLLVMSQMSDEIIAKCTPSQKISEMKALLKGIPDDDGADDQDNTGAGGESNSTRKPPNTIRGANMQELFSISSADELEKVKDVLVETIRKAIGQGKNGVNYGVSVVMTW